MAVAFTRNGVNEGRVLKDEAWRHLLLINLDANFSFVLIIVPLTSVPTVSRFFVWCYHFLQKKCFPDKDFEGK